MYSVLACKLVIYSAWYGDEFTELFFNSLVPSLKRPDGLSEISTRYKITWRIYISDEQYLKVKNLYLKEISSGTTVHTTCKKK